MSKVFWSRHAQEQVCAAYRSLLQAWTTSHTEVRVPTSQGETFVLVSGPLEAPPLVLLPGSMATSAMWIRSADRWSGRFRIYAVDLIGDAGFSAPSRPSMTSDAHAKWLDDVLNVLAVREARFVGASLGGLLALDYAIRRPTRVKALALLAPGGIGRVRLKFLLKTGPLLFLGPWGHRKALEFDMGFESSEESEARDGFLNLFRLVQQSFVARMQPLPTFSDKSLRSVNMPTWVAIGGRDAIFDSAETRARIATCIPAATVRYLEDSGHGLRDLTEEIDAFLSAV